ncbi:glycosyltransferase family 4 protein [Paenibacillus sp. IHBB 10380]|uniref:glycosyltransferase family 4 protein n=1 Tax=Paenibacillus sp. IHBB 10380 TaxID=1566358 RepID=UPI00069893F2|nr:glycosyltransferase family 4 protein [Paenibacillus sp. IHBB 10380]
MKKPKLMLFCHVSNIESITGSEKLLLLFCRHISASFDCILVAPQEGKFTTYARQQQTEVRIQPYPLHYEMYTPHANLLNDVEAYRNAPNYDAILRLIVEISPNVVLTNTCVNIVPAMAAKSLGIPVVWKLTEVITENAYTSLAVQWIDQNSDWVIAISHAVAQSFVGNMTSPISILYPSIGLRMNDILLNQNLRILKRKALELSSNESCIGYISSFIYEDKGLKQYIEMALLLCVTHPDARFLVIGSSIDNGYFDACVCNVKESGYESRFTFIPYVKTVHPIYCAMDILVIPSMVNEGFGLTALEGLASAKPVVTFSSGGLVEMMQSIGNQDRLVGTGDSQGLATKVAYLLDHPDEAAAIGKHNQVIANTLYGIDSFMQKLLEMIQHWGHVHPEWFIEPILSPFQFQLQPSTRKAIHARRKKRLDRRKKRAVQKKIIRKKSRSLKRRILRERGKFLKKRYA